MIDPHRAARRAARALLGAAVLGLLLRPFFLPSLLLGSLLWPMAALSFVLAAARGIAGVPATAGLALALLLAGPASSFLRAARPGVLAAEQPIRELSLVTHNVLYEGGDAEATAEQLRAVDAEVLFLQEVSRAKAAVFAERLPGWPHRVFEPAVREDGRGHGAMVLSRHPLRAGPRFLGARGNVIGHCVEVRVPDHPLVACSVHLTSPSVALEVPRSRFLPVLVANAEERARQWEDITGAAAAMDPGHGHRVILGDMNVLPVEPLYRRMRRDWVDAWRELRWAPGPTYPAGHHGPPNALWRPGVSLVRPDMVWTGPSVRPLTIHRLPATGSDHHPLYATIAY